jgi:hypothetical protein
MDLNNKINEYIKKYFNNKNIYNLIVVFLVGVLILIVADFFNSSKTNTKATMAQGQQQAAQTQTAGNDIQKQTQNDLQNILNSMKGVGHSSVIINYESGEELVPALNTNDVSSSIKERDTSGGERTTISETKGNTVVMNNQGNDSEPVIVKKYNPKVSSVIIVAEGAEDKQIQLDVKNMIASYFSITTDKVNVYPMK